MKKYNISVVGATGLVGRMVLKVMEEYNLPVNNLRLFASKNSTGKTLIFHQKEYKVEELKEGCFKETNYVIFSAGAEVSKVWAKVASSEGAIVVDNSSCFRMDDDVALIVPEINILDYHGHSKIIANPNCSTIQCVLPLKPLDEIYHLKRIIYTTYQAVSGSGKKGLDDLKRTEDGYKNEFYPYNISKTVIPEIDLFNEDGYSKEEMKMVNETRKILHNPNIKISSTCVRVPIERSHAVSILCEFEKEPDLDEVRKILENTESVVLLDKPKEHIYPVSTLSTGNDKVYVGRIRKDLSSEKGLYLYTVADNLRRGAASNAVLIVKRLIEMGEE